MSYKETVEPPHSTLPPPLGPSSIDVKEVSLREVFPNPDQPRRHFKDSDMQSLSRSISDRGVLQPLWVRKRPEGEGFQIVAGERRWRAAKQVGLDSLPVIIMASGEEDTLTLALVENLQRASLSPIEEAKAYKQLIEAHGLTQEQCAVSVGKDRSTVANLLRVLQLPKSVQSALEEGKLTLGHAKALLGVAGYEEQRVLGALIVEKGLSVRQAEALCRRHNKGAGRTGGSVKVNPDLEYMADGLRGYLQTKVKIVGSGGRGKIEISYFTPAELERLTSLLKK